MAKQGTILVVDDNKGILTAVQMLLGTCFEKVILALRDQEGLSLDTSRSLYRLRRHRSGGTRNQGRGYRFRGKALGQR